MIKTLFYEVLKEAKDGLVIVDGDPWYVGFNSVIFKNGKEECLFNENNNITLVIKDEEEFLSLLEEYLILEKDYGRKCISFINRGIDTKLKFIIMNLFTNMSAEEFLNPCDMLRRKMEFLRDSIFDYLDEETIIEIDDSLNNANIVVKRSMQSVMMETPYKLDVGLKSWSAGKDIDLPLACISYGIALEDGEKVCYVYSIMRPKAKKELSPDEVLFAKKINRTLYKLNEGVMDSESDEFKAYRNRESDYYPENISDVTHSFVLVGSVFVGLLQKEGVSKIKLVPYLPVRYLGRDLAAMNIKDVSLRQERTDRNNMIQDNATDKFMRTFRRVAFHMGSDMELVGVPYEFDEFMTFTLYEKSMNLNNPILEDVSRGISRMEKGKNL